MNKESGTNFEDRDSPSAGVAALERALRLERAFKQVQREIIRMEHSRDLHQVAQMLYQSIESLQAEINRISILIVDDQQSLAEVWSVRVGHLDQVTALPLEGHHVISSAFKKWKSGKVKQEELMLAPLELRSYGAFLSKHVPGALMDFSPETLRSSDGRYFSMHFNRFGWLVGSAANPLTEESRQILTQAGAVFEQAYVRFLDLKRAEQLAQKAEIEVALERVRSASLSMQSSDQLSHVVLVLYQQLGKLGFSTQFVSIALCHSDANQIEYWSADNLDSEHQSSYFVRGRKNHVIRKMWANWKDQSTVTLHLKGERKRKFDSYLLSETDFKLLSREVKQSMRRQKEVWYTSVAMKYGFVDYADDHELPAAKTITLQRFARVFEQAYTRFLDLKTAETQAREAKIEAALERVRAASLAMHDSSDLMKVVAIVLEQVQNLGIKSDSTIINTDLENLDQITAWSALPGEKFPHPVVIPYVDNTIFQSYCEVVQGSKSYVTDRIEKSDKDAWYQHVFDHSKFGELVSEERKKRTFAAPSINRLTAIQYYSLLTIWNFSEHAYSEDEISLLQRIHKVFEQAYIRYLDLKKVEAQAREAQIEAALERVRSASMAMHKTEELAQVVEVIFQQFQALEIDIALSFIGIYNFEGHVADQWHSTASKIEVFYQQWPMEYFQDEINKWKAGEEFVFLDFEGPEAVKQYADRLDQISGTTTASEMREEMGLENIHHTEANHKYGNLGLVQSRKSTAAEQDIVKRFSKVFEQAYTRFLDLQKAEAQAREAKIEASLERVRSASMAMHKSADIHHVITEIYTQLQFLNLNIDQCFIDVFEEESDDLHFWIATGSQKEYPRKVRIPYYRCNVLTKYRKAKRVRPVLSVDYFDTKEIRTFFNYAFTKSDLKGAPQTRKKLVADLDHWHRCAFFTHHLSVVCSRYRDEPFTPQEQSIIERFARVFDQSYTRFLDLERAEAQAREAQIEAALERVRAASMAMHDSTALAEIALVVFDQMKLLGVPLSWTWFTIIQDDEKTMHAWHTHVGGTFNPDPLIQQISDYAHSEKMMKAWRDQVPSVENEWSGRSLQAYTEMMSQVTGYTKTSSYKALLKNHDKTLFETDAVFEYGFIGISSFDKREEEHREILIRFAGAFGQAYTRFLDLRKAEAQAREAQIEASLERVRSASMAMHKSEELKKVVTITHAQLNQLGLNLDGAVITIRNENQSRDIIGWVHTKLSGVRKGHLPYYRGELHTGLYKVIHEGKGLEIEAYSLAQVRRWYQFLFTTPAWSQRPEESRKDLLESLRDYYRSSWVSPHTVLTMLRFNGVPFRDDEHSILERFAKVFEQSYIRYLDLEMAEARAREALIEASLERVRNKAIAMENSSQANEVVSSIHKELYGLGIPSASCYIYVVHEEAIDLWLTRPTSDGISSIQLRVDWRTVPALSENHKRWSRGDENAVYEFRGKEVLAWYRALQAGSEGAFEVPNQVPDYQQNIEVFSGFGGIGILNFQPQDLESIMPTLTRFGKSFEQVYTRFRDLQKAEAQAREAQIEAALERIRSTALAMHHSSELINTVNAILEQITTLGIPIHAVHIYEFIDQLSNYNIWASAPGQQYAMQLKCPPFKHPIFERWQKAFDHEEDYFALQMGKGDKNRFFRHFFKNSMHDVPEDRQQLILGAPSLSLAMTIQKHTGIAFIRYQNLPLNRDESTVMKRLAVAFEQAYTRFLDLKRSEEQAREAEVEVSLELVRTTALAMQHSDDLGKVAETVFTELNRLGINAMRCGIGLIDKETRQVDMWTTTLSAGKTQEQVTGDEILEGHPLLDGIYQHWLTQAPFSYTLSGSDLKDYYKVIASSNFQLPDEVANPITPTCEHYYLCVMNPSGGLYAFKESAWTEEARMILQRFTDAFYLAYRRYEDLQKAEARAKEAKVEAALERVRAGAMAMHSSEDLVPTCGQIVQELADLTVHPGRFGFGQMSEEDKTAELYTIVSKMDPGQLKLAFKIPLVGHPVMRNIYRYWKNK
ncbi:MAG: hypothetical protein KTR24_16920, partial [Saprospiraceae bacterium]|nr:hypothetical protein [Saprospiraceae bacterium]